MSRVDSIALFKIKDMIPFKGSTSRVPVSVLMKQNHDSVHFGTTITDTTQDLKKEVSTPIDTVKIHYDYSTASEIAKLARRFKENIRNPNEIKSVINDVENNRFNSKEFIKDFVLYTDVNPKDENDKSTLLDYAMNQESLDAAQQFFDYLKKADDDTQKSFLRISQKFAEKDYEFRPKMKPLALEILAYAVEKIPEDVITWELSADIKKTAKYLDIVDKIADCKDIDKKVRTDYFEKNKNSIPYAQKIIDKINAETSKEKQMDANEKLMQDYL